MYTIRSFILFVALIALSCCKKKTEAVPVAVQPPQESYTLLKPGNYWVYRDFTVILSTDTTIPRDTYDSCYIEKDTSLNGHTYHKYATIRNVYGSSRDTSFILLRDSLNYLVDHNGRVLFASQDFTSIFTTYTFGPNNSTGDTLLVTEQMRPEEAILDVPAGRFRALAFMMVFHYPPGRSVTQASMYTWYASGVGIVCRSKGFYFVAPTTNHTEQRLVRYHVQ